MFSRVTIVAPVSMRASTVSPSRCAMAVRTAIAHLDGETVEARIDTGATMVTRENMQEPAVAALLSPDLSILEGE